MKMVTDTRSARKNKDESDDNSVEKELCSGKGSSNCSSGNTDVRKSSKKTSSSREMTSSPLSLRPSKRLENPTSPSSLPMTRKSERLEKQNNLSPLRRSDRDNKNMSSSSNSKQSPKELSLSVLKRKKEKRRKNLIQVTMESKKAELDLESVGVKRRKMNARAFKALFKAQRIKETVPDVDGELEAPYKISQLCNGDDGGITLEPMGKGDDISDECSKGVVEKLRDGGLDNTSGDLQKSICSLRGVDTDILGNDISIDSNHIDIAVDGPPEPPCINGLKDSRSNLSVKETFDGSERLPTNCSTTKNMDAPDLGNPTCIARLRHGARYFENGEKCTQEKDVNPSPSVTCEIHSLMGTCVLCCKKKRVCYGSPKQELCSCCAAIDKDLSSFCTCKDRGDHEAAVPLESVEKCCSSNLIRETYPDYQIDDHQNAFVMCDKDGELLCCEGHGCKRCYHLCCLDPPLADALPGVWHCPRCVRKKFLFGVHSVSEGVESIWDVREVEVSNTKGMHWQKQYLVKYHGLAHVHNLWVSEKQLCHENHRVVSNFIAKDQNVGWSSEWTVPHRLLRKRSLRKFPISSSVDTSECHYEWLVKWQGLNYDHATWELDSAYFLSSALGQNLMKDYETRHEKAKKVDKHQKGSFVDLSEFPTSGLPVNDDNLLKNVNELRDCWFKCQNAVVFNNQEQARTVILFILSLTETCQPFLIVVSSDSLSQWEAEFARVAPLVDVVVYGGNRDTRKGIRTSEFYGDCVMLQVLLSSPQAVFEDIDKLTCIRWEAIVIVDYQHFAIPNTLKQMKVLTADSRIILVNDKKRDIIPEYLNILSLLDSHGDFDKLRILNSDKNYNPGKLNERLSHYIAYWRTSEVSKFLEYWVPVQISNYQLELYCDTLLSNSSALCSCSKNDSVGALREILLTVRKCCDHPYLVDSYVQEALFAEQHPVSEILDIGIKASGKLRLLDSMLAEIKSQGLQVLILFQMIVGSGGVSIGDILDDFVRQRFGENIYERVDATVIPSKKQAAVNRFNKKETGQFVFLLENRACSSAIKLPTLDLIIIYDSDWNPANDLRSLQKISIDSKVEQIKVFRLYSSCTVEERALVLAKQHLNLEINLQNLSRATSDSLLMWGASYQFSKLDEYHAESNSDGFKISSEQLLLNEVSKELRIILSENCENIDYKPRISKVWLDVGSYNMNILMLGEEKIQLKDGVEPHIFWRNVLDRKKPQWKNLRGQCARNRKRVQCLEGLPRDSCSENNDVAKKCKRVVNENVDPVSVQLQLTEHQLPQVAGSIGGPSTTIASNRPQSLQRDGITTNNNPNCTSGQSSFDAEVDTVESEERFPSLNEKKSRHGFLQEEMTRLCQVLELSEDVTHVVRRILEYAITNHDVSSDSPAITHAFQISLCWIAALISKQKVDKKHSFILAKQLLNFQCTEEQVNSVYSKMRRLKWMYLQSSVNTMDSGKDFLLADEDISKEPSNINEGAPLDSILKLKNVKIEMEDMPANEEHAEAQILSQQNIMKDKIKKKCEKRMKKLIRRQQKEKWELQRTWEEAREKLEADHKLESAVTRAIHNQGSVRNLKLKLLDDNFAKNLEEHNLLKDMQLKDLEAKQLAAQNEERQKAVDLLAEAEICLGELRAVDGPQTFGLQSDDDAGCSQLSAHITLIGTRNIVSKSQQQLEDQNLSQSVPPQGNDVGPSDKSIRAPAEALIFVPTETLAVHSHTEVGAMPLDRSPLTVVEQPNHSFQSSDTTGDIGSADLPDSVERVSGEIRLAELNEKAPTEVPIIVPDDVEGHVDLGELSNASNNGDPIGLLDTEVNQRDEPDVSSNGGLPFPGQSLEQLEQTQAFPNCCGLLSQHVSQDETHQSLASAELLEQDAPDVEVQSTSQIEVAAFELIDPVTLMQTNHETPVAGNCEQLHSVPVDVSHSCNQTPLIEIENQNQDQGRRSSQTAQAGETEEFFHEPASRRSEDSQLQHIPLDLGPATRTANEQSSELFAHSQNSMATAVSTGELPNHAVLPSEIDAGHLRVPSNLPFHPIHESASWIPTPPLVAEPLQNELERLHNEAEQLKKIHEDMTSRLKSDCEKEIQETIIQIRCKYGVKIHDAQTEYELKKNEIEKNQNKILMNKRLAEAFRSKCLDLKSSWHSGIQQAFPSNFLQHLPPTRLSPGTFQPSPSQQGTSPSAQAMHQLLMPSSMRFSPVSSQDVVASPSTQAVQHGTPVFSSTSSRPPVISAITPAANIRIGGEIRSPAPHLQPFRPAATSMAPATAPSMCQQHPQQILPTQLLLMPRPPPPPLPHLPTNVSQDIPVPQSGQPNPLNPSLSVMELLRNINHPVAMNHNFSPLPDIDSTFGLLEPSDFDTLGNAQGNQASSAVVANIVCLSDDD